MTLTIFRPLWLLPTPEPVKRRQQQLWWNGNLTLIQEPERIESHWWQATPVSRDYFVARHEQEPLYWLFRDIKTRRWFLQGGVFLMDDLIPSLIQRQP